MEKLGLSSNVIVQVSGEQNSKQKKWLKTETKQNRQREEVESVAVQFPPSLLLLH